MGRRTLKRKRFSAGAYKQINQDKKSVGCFYDHFIANLYFSLSKALYFLWIHIMNLDKSTKLITKRVKKGFQGYPQISITYFGDSANCATEVVVGFISEEGVAAQEQKFSSNGDARNDETIQTTLLKVIERAGAKTVLEAAGISIIK